MKRNTPYKILSGFIIAAGFIIFFSLNGSAKVRVPPKNIVFIVIDALRPDHLRCYGYERHTSPNMDILAQQGVRFTQAISAAGWTGESVPSLLTGVYPPTHHIRSWRNARNPSIQTLPDILTTRGYHCVFWSNHGSMEFVDIQSGFQEVHLENTYEGDKPSVSDQQLTQEIISSLEKRNKGSPFFLYIHYSGAHVPYRMPPEYKHLFSQATGDPHPERVPLCPESDDQYKGQGCIPRVVAENGITDPAYYVSQYDGAIAYADTQIGSLMRSLSRLGLDDNTIVILLSDHGEMLGEHGIYFNHAGGYDGGYEENIRVPLIMRGMTEFARGEVLSEQVSTVDIVPTLLEVIGCEKPPSLQGNSLLTLHERPASYSGKHVYSFFGTGDWVVIRTKDWKAVHYYPSDSWKLFHLESDPRENNNMARARPDVLDALREELDNFQKRINGASSPATPQPLSEQERGRLKSLGYAQ